MQEVVSDVRNRSPLRQALDHLKHDKVAWISGSVILFFAMIAVAAPLFEKIIGVGPNDFNSKVIDISKGSMPLGSFGGISAQHWFGVEPRTGRDLFLRFVYGARTSLSIALLSALLATIIGVLIGLAAGFFGGKIDQVLSRLMEIVLAFPSILFALAITPVLESVLENSGWISESCTPNSSARSAQPVAIAALANCNSRTSRWLKKTSSVNI